ncbi:MAG TPA: betaine/proline/choline family ABC transporter ATP-binding protein [Bacillota bacterium]|nr:betaine/proline/choline family ABC transporter ATP-binding protein [Bacillota bacterium]
MNTPVISTRGLTKVFGYSPQAAVKLLREGMDKDAVFRKLGSAVGVYDVSLDIERGRTFVIIGLSGSGKSTLVRLMNLLLRPTCGSLLFEGEDIVGLKGNDLIDYRRNKVSMVFQGFGLMGHRDVLGNVCYGLEVKGVRKDKRIDRAMEMIGLVGLSGWEHQPISSLSGGMKQRVGLARALANDPEVLLMDEPFSALDPIVRRDMQFELLGIQKKVKKTMVFITHDINEAFKLGDRVAIMKDAKVVRIGSPEEILSDPGDEYIEQFVRDIDRSKVLLARNVMITPASLVKIGDGPNVALKEMKSNSISSVFVIGDNMDLVGIVTLDSAMKARAANLSLTEIIENDIIVTDPDTPIADLIPIAARAKFPIAVLDPTRRLLGIVTKAAVLSSLT